MRLGLGEIVVLLIVAVAFFKPEKLKEYMSVVLKTADTIKETKEAISEEAKEISEPLQEIKEAGKL